ncbi:MAG: hypothetical protein HC904_02350 [Blastochloris sp.]|nr:hypothetical protein [Blastochloris sp.]
MESGRGLAFTGLLGRYGKELRFKNGAVLKDVSLVNPPGVFSPVSEEEKYLALALFARDGQPLEQSRELSLSLVSTSFNTGFEMSKEGAPTFNKPPAGTKAGTLPVLVVRVGGCWSGRLWTA